jgi:hypothetical protein
MSSLGQDHFVVGHAARRGNRTGQAVDARGVMAEGGSRHTRTMARATFGAGSVSDPADWGAAARAGSA